ncbi:MAG TPA: hypothetical protein VK963_00290 [Candidatus Saccharimonadales bacterium]|nr:hypothetical protein [Candidatus Saccharimonadales bacterium]
MDKYLTKRFAKKLLLIGFIVFIVGLIIMYTALFSAYDLAGQQPPGAPGPGPTWQGSVVTLGSYITVAGYSVVLIGLVDLVVGLIRKK